MRKILTLLVFGMLLLNISLASANGEHQTEIEEGKKLVESKISCDKLNDEQLEAIGDYYMEQMHPGDAHELMHEMMGGHDSELTKNMHVNMARSIYCGETNQDMMGMMQGMMGSGGMMGGSMMNGQPSQANMMQGMEKNWGYFSYWNFINVLYAILLIGVIIFVYLRIIKL
mgnify:CR=1 FL=1